MSSKGEFSLLSGFGLHVTQVLLGRIHPARRVFAHLKTTMRFERMRLRGLTGARDEFHLAAIAQNLRRMVRVAAAMPA